MCVSVSIVCDRERLGASETAGGLCAPALGDGPGPDDIIGQEQ